MPDQATIERARRDHARGKSSSTQAGEFVREEIHHIRQGKHGARSTKQAIAIGLSKARRAGVKLPLPRKGNVSENTRHSTISASRAGRNHANHHPSRKRSRATLRALRRESHTAASHRALSRHARIFRAQSLRSLQVSFCQKSSADPEKFALMAK